MSDKSPNTLYFSNRYKALAACEHCGGIVLHERWCITLHALVRYAYQIVDDADKLTARDALLLHSLGVTWKAKPCRDSG
jgi:hypothetical protein